LRKPYSVVLFDEVEKAHPNVWNLLLQVLDDGRLTDSHGKLVNFRNTIIIMTSNLGAQQLLEGVTKDGKLPDSVRQSVLKLVKGHFRPEFLNRLDDTVVFTPLTRQQLTQIVHLQLGLLRDNLVAENINIFMTEKAAEKVIEMAYDPAYGARPINRFVEKEIGTEIAKLIVRGTIDSNMNITLDVDSSGTFSYKIHKKPEQKCTNCKL